MDNILDLINNNNWQDAIKQSTNLFEPIMNGKNIFHIACIRGQENVILGILNLKSSSIFISDFAGNTGAHLLAINGWDNILIKMINIEPMFLQLKNNNDRFVYNYVLERKQTFFEIIKCMELFKLTNYLNFVRNDGYTLLLDIISMIKDITSPNFEILQFVINLKNKLDWNISKNTPPLIYLINSNKNDICNYVLDNVPSVDINIISKNETTPLIASLLQQSEKLAIKLINMGADVNFSGPENMHIPLALTFKNWLPDVTKKLMENKNLDYNKKDNALNTPIYFLLDSIANNTELLTTDSEPLIMDIMKTMIINSDLLNTNIRNTTPMHLLVKFGMWKKFKDILQTKQFDVNAFDRDKNNILKYLSDEDLPIFMKIIDKQLKSTKNNKIKIQQSKLILPIEILQEDKLDYGMFNADSVHNTMYILYILKKYNNCIIPLQYNVSEKRIWDKYKIHTQYSPHNEIMNLIHSVVSFYQDTFYCLVPHIIYWRNKTIYFKDRNLSLYLSRAIKDNRIRFVIIKLSLIPHSNIMHANIVIYDKQRNTIVRFEPYGDWDLLDSYWLDKMLMKLIKKSINKEQNETLKYIRPTEYLNKTKFQTASFGDRSKHKNLGDPEGYCLAWCYWFTELKLLNPDVDEKTLVELALDDILKLSNANDKNPLLTHIRSYGKHLDNQKNILFEKIGINKYDFYKLSYDSEKLEMCKKYVEEFVSSCLLRQ